MQSRVCHSGLNTQHLFDINAHRSGILVFPNLDYPLSLVPDEQITLIAYLLEQMQVLLSDILTNHAFYETA